MTHPRTQQTGTTTKIPFFYSLLDIVGVFLLLSREAYIRTCKELYSPLILFVFLL